MLMVKKLFNRGFSAGKIFKQFKCPCFNRTFIHKNNIHRLQYANSCKNKPKYGLQCLLPTKKKKMHQRIREMIRRNPQHSANK